MGKFELFLGNFGNGTIACNKAVYVNGDFKQVAHISPAGNIKLYVKPEYIPNDAMMTIEKVANNSRNKTIKKLDLLFNVDRYDFNYNYFRVLEEISKYCHWKDTFNLLDSINGKDIPEKVGLIKDFYLSHF